MRHILKKYIRQFIWSVLAAASFNPAFAQNLDVQSITNQVNLDSLSLYVRQLSGAVNIEINGQTDSIRSRSYIHPDNEKAFQFLKETFNRWGYQADSVLFENGRGKNLIIIKPGYKYPDKWFMLGAHYDSAPHSGLAPGADDNASGCAAVLEAGRIFSEYNFPYTVVLALWDEEEIGLVGSRVYVPGIGDNNETLLGYINLDMIAWDGNEDDVAQVHVRQVAHSAALQQRAQYCNDTYNIGLNLEIVDPGSAATDHQAFWLEGLPAIGISEAYDDDFNPHYHSADDIIEQFNFDFFLKCSKLAISTIAELALDTNTVVGVQQKYFSSSIRMYPNPFHQDLVVEHKNGESIERVMLLNALGGVVQVQQVNSPKANISLHSDVPAGIYFLQVASRDGLVTIPVVKR